MRQLKAFFVSLGSCHGNEPGDRKGIEELTNTWDKTIIDRTEDLSNWVGLFRQFVTRGLKIFAYANNHYAVHGQATVKTFCELWNKR